MGLKDVNIWAIMYREGGVVNVRCQGVFTEWCEMNLTVYGKNISTFEKSK